MADLGGRTPQDAKSRTKTPPSRCFFLTLKCVKFDFCPDSTGKANDAPSELTGFNVRLGRRTRRLESGYITVRTM